MLFTDVSGSFLSSCFHSFACPKAREYGLVCVKVLEVVIDRFDSTMDVYSILSQKDKISEISHPENCIVTEYLVSANHSWGIRCSTKCSSKCRKKHTAQIPHFLPLPLASRAIYCVRPAEPRKWRSSRKDIIKYGESPDVIQELLHPLHEMD